MTTIITGASNGIGRELAIALAGTNLGKILHLTYRSNESAARDVYDRCVEKGADFVTTSQVDMLDVHSIERFVGFIESEVLMVETLILNAGILTKGDLESQTAESIHEQVMVNLCGPMHMVHQLWSFMPRRIVFIGSDVGVTPIAGMAPYCASKAGLRGFAQAIAAETIGYKMPAVVACINPDKTGTAMNGGEGRPPELVARVISEYLLSMDALEPGFHEFNLNEHFKERRVACLGSV